MQNSFAFSFPPIAPGDGMKPCGGTGIFISFVQAKSSPQGSTETLNVYSHLLLQEILKPLQKWKRRKTSAGIRAAATTDADVIGSDFNHNI